MLFRSSCINKWCHLHKTHKLAQHSKAGITIPGFDNFSIIGEGRIIQSGWKTSCHNKFEAFTTTNHINYNQASFHFFLQKKIIILEKAAYHSTRAVKDANRKKTQLELSYQIFTCFWFYKVRNTAC